MKIAMPLAKNVLLPLESSILIKGVTKITENKRKKIKG